MWDFQENFGIHCINGQISVDCLSAAVVKGGIQKNGYHFVCSAQQTLYLVKILPSII